MSISAATRVLGVIGHPVAHSFSPAMHNAAIAALGVDYVYVAFCVAPDRTGDAVRGMRALGIRGLNVTIPHKLSVMDHLDDVSGEAAAVGAVNTISLESDGRLVGCNTDVYGLMTALRLTAGLDALPPHAVVLGAGGVARAAVYGLGGAQGVSRITILNRTVERAERLAESLRGITGKPIDVRPTSAMREAFRDAGLVVNATSAGMHPNEQDSPVADEALLHPGLTVYDTVFNPLDTRLMKQARARGARAFGGLDMLVFQGARSFEIWTGLKPSAEVMKAAVMDRLHA